jgi:hypothetical protein
MTHREFDRADLAGLVSDFDRALRSTQDAMSGAHFDGS